MIKAKKGSKFFSNGKSEYKNSDITGVAEGTEETIGMDKGNVLNTGMKIWDSSIVGSSAVTMQIDLPSFFMYSDKIMEIKGNVTEVVKYAEDVVKSLKELSGVSNGNEQIINKIIASAQIGKGRWSK